MGHLEVRQNSFVLEKVLTRNDVIKKIKSATRRLNLSNFILDFSIQ